MKNHVCVCTCMFYIKTYNIVELPWWKKSEQIQEFRRISYQFIVIWYMYIGDHLWSQNNWELVKHLFWKWCDIWFYLSRADEDGAGEKDARHLIRKIRRQVRFLNRKWAELNQDSNEWQAQLDEVSEVSLGCFFCHSLMAQLILRFLKVCSSDVKILIMALCLELSVTTCDCKYVKKEWLQDLWYRVMPLGGNLCCETDWDWFYTSVYTKTFVNT